MTTYTLKAFTSLQSAKEKYYLAPNNSKVIMSSTCTPPPQKTLAGEPHLNGFYSGDVLKAKSSPSIQFLQDHRGISFNCILSQQGFLIKLMNLVVAKWKKLRSDISAIEKQLFYLFLFILFFFTLGLFFFIHTAGWFVFHSTDKT